MQTGKKWLARGLAVLLAVLMLASVLTLLFRGANAASLSAEDFDDLEAGAWYWNAVDFGLDSGLFTGMADRIFEPKTALSRAMYVQLLLRISEQAIPEKTAALEMTQTFSDVKKSAWYQRAAAFGAACGVVLGYEDGTFRGDLPLTREQAATMTVRFLEWATETKLETAELGFADAAKISSYAKDAVGSGVLYGILQGKTGNVFDPKATMSRAEAAQMLLNLTGGDLSAVHLFSDGVQYLPGTGGICSYQARHCTLCGYDQYAEEITCSSDIPVIELVGDVSAVTKDKTATLEMHYLANDQTFDSICTLKYQGNSSLQYEKKNYNIKLFKDEDLEKKNKVDLGWGKENKYCLKANYIDRTACRNLVSAKLWGDVVRTRKSAEAPLPDLVNGGAVDGYPVMLYINEIYQGLYTLNIPKDKWMLENDDHKVMGIMTTEDWNDEGYFRAPATVDGGHWEIEENAMESDEAIFESLNRLIRFVIDNDGIDFHDGIGEYLDVNAYIDYLCFAMAATLQDNTGKNCMFVTYDGVKWIATMYDMDASWGLFWDGGSLVTYSTMVPKVENSRVTSPFGRNLLAEKMFACFGAEIRARYFELREHVLSEENINAEFAAFNRLIPAHLFETEALEYPLEPGAGVNTPVSVSNHLKRHIKLLDTAMRALPEQSKY